MGDMGEVFNAIKEEKRAKRQNNLKNNQQLIDSSWTIHSEYHVSKTVRIEDRDVRVEFWPSSNKWKVGNRYYRGSLPKALKEIIHGVRSSET